MTTKTVTTLAYANYSAKGEILETTIFRTKEGDHRADPLFTPDENQIMRVEEFLYDEDGDFIAPNDIFFEKKGPIENY